ncbi:MAG TPA: hypothetical protein PLB79_05520 [Thermotogota bacterium]|jgi:TolB protein|nr:PD40 domain-containing protein [Thermotogota bacterium]NLH19897.1 hypothetical protein [Thermotogaceae bacterium]OQC32550.1 MAG: translocation protein TolB [Thermotogota bacterium ADurb.Bin062]HNW46965.1 hypothetical protein [Thermotogota bacterium]HNY82132.1 hypothetical protein [Thermotogota bacterium]
MGTFRVHKHVKNSHLFLTLLLLLLYSALFGQAIDIKVSTTGAMTESESAFIKEFRNEFASMYERNASGIFYSAKAMAVSLSFGKENSTFFLRAAIEGQLFYTEKGFRSLDRLALSQSVTQCVENLLVWFFLRRAFQTEKRIGLSDLLYEYPHFSADGRFFTYITEKRTGNANPLVVSLTDGTVFLLELPMKTEFYPRVYGEFLYYLQSLEGAREILRVPLSRLSDRREGLYEGDVTGYSVRGNELIWSEKNRLLRKPLDGKGPYSEEPLPPNASRIQSFDIADHYWAISLAREGAQYDLYLYDPVRKTGLFLTHTPYQEVDVRFSKDGTMLVFSSNPDGNFNLFYFDLVNNRLGRVTQNAYDEFYPAFTPDGSGLVFCRYETKSEPYLVALPLR